MGARSLHRVRCGSGFSYVDWRGERVDDRETLDWIESLVIPPAWRKVWICPYPNGHIQAVGRDTAGRRVGARWRQGRRKAAEV